MRKKVAFTHSRFKRVEDLRRRLRRPVVEGQHDLVVVKSSVRG